MENKSLLIKRGDFQITLDVLAGETTKITFTIPNKPDEVYNPNDYLYLITHIMELCMTKNDGKYDKNVEHIKEDKDKKHMKYIISSLDFYESKFKEIYPETIVSKELVFYKFYKDRAYELSQHIDSTKFISSYDSGYISKCAKGELFDTKIWGIIN